MWDTVIRIKKHVRAGHGLEIAGVDWGEMRIDAAIWLVERYGLGAGLVEEFG